MMSNHCRCIVKMCSMLSNNPQQIIDDSSDDVEDIVDDDDDDPDIVEWFDGLGQATIIHIHLISLHSFFSWSTPHIQWYV